MKRFALIAYLAALHLLLAVVLLKSDFIPRMERKLGLQAPELTDHFLHMVQYHAGMDASVPDKAIIFIGDSITQSLAVNAVASPAVNYGIGGDTTAGVLQRIPGYASLKRASAVVVAIGVNDLGTRSNEEIVANLKEIAQKLPPGIPCVFSAILPVDEPALGLAWNARISSINAELAKLCRARPGTHFMDAGPSMTTAQGNLAAANHTGDGLHLSPAGYAIWIAELKKALSQMSAS